MTTVYKNMIILFVKAINTASPAHTPIMTQSHTIYVDRPVDEDRTERNHLNEFNSIIHKHKYI